MCETVKKKMTYHRRLRCELLHGGHVDEPKLGVLLFVDARLPEPIIRHLKQGRPGGTAAEEDVVRDEVDRGDGVRLAVLRAHRAHVGE